MTGSLAFDYTLAADHPALPGHFPGRPLMPGALLLAEVVEVARTQPDLGERYARGATLIAAKFLAPVEPGARLRFVLDWDDVGLRFAVTGAGRAVAEGRWTWAPVGLRDAGDAEQAPGTIGPTKAPTPTPTPTPTQTPTDKPSAVLQFRERA
ncbi:MAG TPA: hypothetical protein VH328_11020 [Burkholderiaceae bacterium]|nr:hypothetical protein [Burkholderiaceae bacterium]